MHIAKFDDFNWLYVPSATKVQKESQDDTFVFITRTGIENQKAIILHDDYTAIAPYIFGNRKIKLVPIPSILST